MSPKWQRAENLSEKKHLTKPVNQACERHICRTLFCRLTPELSRAERGGCEPVLPACREVSTKPRYGVGLNDLLGGKEAGEGEGSAHLPKAEAGEHERAPRTFSWTCQR